MFSLTPFEYSNHPFASFDPFKEMEDIERKFFGRQLPAFKTDIRETENAYILEADLPGFTKEDINAEVKDGVLMISAQRQNSVEDKDKAGNYIRRERSYGSYKRYFDLNGINSDEISASYKDGVLSLTLPKAKAKIEEGRKLEIK